MNPVHRGTKHPGQFDRGVCTRASKLLPRQQPSIQPPPGDVGSGMLVGVGVLLGVFDGVKVNVGGPAVGVLLGVGDGTVGEGVSVGAGVLVGPLVAVGGGVGC